MEKYFYVYAHYNKHGQLKYVGKDHRLTHGKYHGKYVSN